MVSKPAILLWAMTRGRCHSTSFLTKAALRYYLTITITITISTTITMTMTMTISMTMTMTISMTMTITISISTSPSPSPSPCPNFQPQTRGKLVTCTYWVEIDATVPCGSDVDLRLPVTIYAPQVSHPHPHLHLHLHPHPHLYPHLLRFLWRLGRPPHLQVGTHNTAMPRLSMSIRHLPTAHRLSVMNP